MDYVLRPHQLEANKVENTNLDVSWTKRKSKSSWWYVSIRNCQSLGRLTRIMDRKAIYGVALLTGPKRPSR